MDNDGEAASSPYLRVVRGSEGRTRQTHEPCDSRESCRGRLGELTSHASHASHTRKTASVAHGRVLGRDGAGGVSVVPPAPWNATGGRTTQRAGFRQRPQTAIERPEYGASAQSATACDAMRSRAMVATGCNAVRSGCRASGDRCATVGPVSSESGCNHGVGECRPGHAQSPRGRSVVRGGCRCPLVVRTRLGANTTQRGANGWRWWPCGRCAGQTHQTREHRESRESDRGKLGSLTSIASYASLAAADSSNSADSANLPSLPSHRHPITGPGIRTAGDTIAATIRGVVRASGWIGGTACDANGYPWADACDTAAAPSYAQVALRAGRHAAGVSSPPDARTPLWPTQRNGRATGADRGGAVGFAGALFRRVACVACGAGLRVLDVSLCRCVRCARCGAVRLAASVRCFAGLRVARVSLFRCSVGLPVSLFVASPPARPNAFGATHELRESPGVALTRLTRTCEKGIGRG
jgi:hypothetical protein